jgi:hypothetical protein
MQKNYPEETALARGAILNEIFEKASKSRQGRGDKSFGSNVSLQIKNMDAGKKEILFGKDGLEKADHLATWFSSLPAEVNASGTGARAGFFDLSKFIGSYAMNGINLFRYKMAEWGPMNKTIGLIGKAIDNPVVRGASAYGGNQAFLPATSDSPSQENLFLPNR